ncbi:hypothetical protein [Nonlabens xiamenensis]|nr:hypothetical protein [Nonlabens xiamenensis]
MHNQANFISLLTSSIFKNRRYQCSDSAFAKAENPAGLYES